MYTAYWQENDLAVLPNRVDGVKVNQVSRNPSTEPAKRGRRPEEGEIRKPLPVGFTRLDREKIQVIREHEGLESDAAAVRHAVRWTHDQLPEEDE